MTERLNNNHMKHSALDGLKESENESHSDVSDSATPWTYFSRPEYWSG